MPARRGGRVEEGHTLNITGASAPRRERAGQGFWGLGQTLCLDLAQGHRSGTGGKPSGRTARSDNARLHVRTNTQHGQRKACGVCPRPVPRACRTLYLPPHLSACSGDRVCVHVVSVSMNL